MKNIVHPVDNIKVSYRDDYLGYVIQIQDWDNNIYQFLLPEDYIKSIEELSKIIKENK